MWVLAAKPDAHYECAWIRCVEAHQVFLAWPAQLGFRFAKNYWALLQPVTALVPPCDGPQEELNWGLVKKTRAAL